MKNIYPCFEKDMIDLISNIEMKPHTNFLKKKMMEDKAAIQKSKNVIISSDKNGNMYKMEPKEYWKFLTNTISRDYKKTNNSLMESINTEAANIASKLN